MSKWDRNIQDLVDENGTSYADFRSALRPKWWRLWLEVAALWLLLLGVGLGVAAFSHASFVQGALVALLGGCMMGFFIASLQLFVHEAVHFNLHPDKRINDLLSNLLISCMTGVDVKSYRKTHWDHHRYLGTGQDSEVSYFDALRWKFFAESLFGIKIFRALFRHLDRQEQRQQGQTKQEKGQLLMVTGIVFNVLLFGALFWAGEFWVAVSWALGVVVFYPFFNTLRQLLEHRDEAADSLGALDMEQVEALQEQTGLATLRMFGNGLFARLFGGAGFNAHLLHHWDPQVSYTNFAELEAFLMKTEYASVIEARRASYWSTFTTLFKPSWS